MANNSIEEAVIYLTDEDLVKKLIEEENKNNIIRVECMELE